MDFIFNLFKKKEEKVNQNTITLYINEKKTVNIDPDPNLTCQQLCKQFAHEFANRNKTPDLRVMVVMEDPRVIIGSSKPGSSSNPSHAQAEKLIITKRVLSPLEKVFTEEFLAQIARNAAGPGADTTGFFEPKMLYKYQLVDMNDFVRISAPIVSFNRTVAVVTQNKRLSRQPKKAQVREKAI